MPKILDQAVKAEDIEIGLEDYFLRVLLTGGSGSGKTTSALSLPGRKLLIDIDGRKNAAAGFKNVRIIDLAKILKSDPKSPQAWLTLMKIKDELWQETRGDFPYNGVIADGLAAMNRMAINWALLLDPSRGLGGTPAKQHWFPAMEAIVNFMKALLALPCHVILTSHIELIKDETTGGLRLTPKAIGKLRTEVEGWFDETYLCHREHGKGGKPNYYWTTAGGGKELFLKSTLNHLGEYWEDPIELSVPKDTSGATPWGFQRLLEKRFGKEKKETKS
ncbi:hypothetical protein LCGC14_0739380 [marine sediment metagenome]|uniref:Uncharacterized protein n=1 Tax=marine sediment metagenome TaxID=412755 RepID=A0A0F9SS25_9ZZZZ